MVDPCLALCVCVCVCVFSWCWYFILVSSSDTTETNVEPLLEALARRSSFMNTVRHPSYSQI